MSCSPHDILCTVFEGFIVCGGVIIYRTTALEPKKGTILQTIPVKNGEVRWQETCEKFAVVRTVFAFRNNLRKRTYNPTLSRAKFSLVRIVPLNLVP